MEPFRIDHFKMETYYGRVKSPQDAIILFEATAQGYLPRVQRRLSDKERGLIRAGSVFVWDEKEAGMRRWTDGKSWSASRVSGSFLTYREMEGKRVNPGLGGSRRGGMGRTPDSDQNSDGEQRGSSEPDGYKYLVDGLTKQSFSMTTKTGHHLHLISYYTKNTEDELPTPSSDMRFHKMVIPSDVYPESTMNEGPTNGRVAMQRSPYAHPSPHVPPRSAYPMQHPHQLLPSPDGTPPFSGHAHYVSALHQHPGPAPPPTVYHHPPYEAHPGYERSLPPPHSSPQYVHGHPIALGPPPYASPYWDTRQSQYLGPPTRDAPHPASQDRRAWPEEPAPRVQPHAVSTHHLPQPHRVSQPLPAVPPLAQPRTQNLQAPARESGGSRAEVVAPVPTKEPGPSLPPLMYPNVQDDATNGGHSPAVRPASPASAPPLTIPTIANLLSPKDDKPMSSGLSSFATPRSASPVNTSHVREAAVEALNTLNRNMCK